MLLIKTLNFVVLNESNALLQHLKSEDKIFKEELFIFGLEIKHGRKSRHILIIFLLILFSSFLSLFDNFILFKILLSIKKHFALNLLP